MAVVVGVMGVAVVVGVMVMAVMVGVAGVVVMAVVVGVVSVVSDVRLTNGTGERYSRLPPCLIVLTELINANSPFSA